MRHDQRPPTRNRLLLPALGSLVLALVGCEPLPGGGPTGPRPFQDPPEIVTVLTENARFFYLIDTRRALCFFGNRYSAQLTRVPCEELPEARQIFGWDEPDYAEEEPVVITPDTAPEDGDEPVEPPTEAERSHFEAAYVELLCARRAEGGAEPPSIEELVARHALSAARYGELKVLLSQDADYWRALSQRAAGACE